MVQALGKVYDSPKVPACAETNSKHTSTMCVGHKGSGSKFPGNTVKAFEEAVRIGADMIELDLILCETGNIIVHHDPYLPDGELVSNASMAYVRSHFPEIPTLQEVLDALNDSSIRLYFDLKCPDIVAPLMKILYTAVKSDGWDSHRFLIASFDHHDLLRVNAFKTAHEIDFETIVIVDSMPLGYAACFVELEVDYISIAQGRLIPQFVDDAHRRGMGVLAWTVNNKNMWKAFMDMGVDGIVTDFPEDFVHYCLNQPCLPVVQETIPKNENWSIESLYPKELIPIRRDALSSLNSAQPIINLSHRNLLGNFNTELLKNLEDSVNKCADLCSRYLRPFLLGEQSFQELFSYFKKGAIIEPGNGEVNISVFAQSRKFLAFERLWCESFASRGLQITFRQ